MGDTLIIEYIPLTGSIALTSDPISGLAGRTLIYSMNGGVNRTLTFIRDDVSLASDEVSLDGMVDQINAHMGAKVASLNSSDYLEFSTDMSLIIRAAGTANGPDGGFSGLLGPRTGLPATAKYDFAQTDQNNASPHAGNYEIVDVGATTLWVDDVFPDSGDFSDPVTDQTYKIERPTFQRISTTAMADQEAEASLYYFDVELVSVGTGDQYNIDADQQLTADGYRSDGWYLTTEDENLSFSTVERPQLVISKSILEEGVDDDPVNAVTVSGQNLQLTYERSDTVEGVNNFISSEIERVICQSPLARHLIPHFVRFDLNYTDGSSEEIVVEDLEKYIRDLFPADALESSDIQKIVSDRGATSIRNPLDLIAIVHYPDRSIYAARSQDALTTGRLAAFIPDVLNVTKVVT